MDFTPYPLSADDWREVAKVPLVHDSWGLPDDVGIDVSNFCYAVRFRYTSFSPGYCGDVYILMGDEWGDFITLKRSTDGALMVAGTDEYALEH